MNNAQKLTNFYKSWKSEGPVPLEIVFGDREDKTKIDNPQCIYINNDGIDVIFGGCPRVPGICIDRRLLRQAYIGTRRFKQIQSDFDNIKDTLKKIEGVLGSVPVIDELWNDYKKLGESINMFVKDETD